MPLIQVLPASHSKGHIARDLIHLSEIVFLTQREDSDLKCDDVELFVGMIGGLFHDIGTAVVGRYQERYRFAPHAEAGAYIFDALAADILPSNLRSLVAYAITSHTLYRKPVTVEKDGISVVRNPYDVEIERGNKTGPYLTRLSDRVDIISIIHPVRHGLAMAKPVDTLFGADRSVVLEPQSELENFRLQFSCRPYQNGSVLQECQILAQSIDPNNWYARQDTSSIRTSLLQPNASDLQRFVEAVNTEPIGLQAQVDSDAFEQYYRLCRLLEPGIDIDEKIRLLKAKFTVLSPEHQQAWAQGFSLLAQELYPNLYERMVQRVNGNSEILQGRAHPISATIQELFAMATKTLEAQSPQYYLADNPFPAPDLVEVLTK